MLVKGTKWAKETFELGSRPTKDTILRWLADEEIPGEIIAGEPYVDADRFAFRDTVKKTISGLDLLT